MEIITGITLCLLCNFAYFLSSAVFYQNLFFSKTSFKNTIRVSNSLDSDQTRRYVESDLGPNCEGYQRNKRKYAFILSNHFYSKSLRGKLNSKFSIGEVYRRIYNRKFSFTATQNVISERISDDIPPQMKILNMAIPVLMHFCSFVSNWSVASSIMPHVIQGNVTL